ncbi:gliding motility-associated C-terminal domain-containing protein [Neolewinella lacunae]|uniref:Gliding motility-associated C-terminal domain-containing protein n=1 Tax=Neolewinella lacunae TaxID=1517758 RepID=A0A923PFD4_9BACT|nr:gliding motility-associated C-terminal domain-containing protein [Neolewinella lacunae]MBC6993113.1 gliding motility-associated C-terminal domain-containing protein [Neolewinella lacunae]MDN3635933.1 gliding motility-associated C-terminal domain-containing protein [Neolewinella lacunae]
MLSRVSILFFLLTWSLTLGAQRARQAEIWHFGKGVQLSFADGSPQLAGPSAMDAYEGIVSLSDTTGQLLFYTNGGGRPPGSDQSSGIIWNRNNEVLYDMRGAEGGGFSARQSSIAFPDPSGVAGSYYLFTMEEEEFDLGGSIPGQPEGRGLSYFRIDMNLNGGLGGVALADQRVYTPAYEALDATPMANAPGYWVICHNQARNVLVVTPVTAEGVGTPVEQNLPFPVRGKLEFSPDGTLLYTSGRLLDFDPTTGRVGAVRNTFPNASPVACFTPDSRYLYYTESRPPLGELIVRYDLRDFSRQDLEVLRRSNSEIVIASSPFQLGPNGNIYFLEQRVQPLVTGYVLSEISCVSSLDPVVNRGIIDLADFRGEGFLPQSLPQYVDAIFKRPVVEDTLRLDTAAWQLCVGTSQTLRGREPGLEYLWSDGSTADTLMVTMAGTYCVTITGGCQPTVDCQEVTLDALAITATLAGTEDRGCDGVFALVNVSTQGRVDSILLTASAETGQTVAFPVNAGQVAIPLAGATNLLQVTAFGPCGTVTSESLSVAVAERFIPRLLVGADNDFCAGSTLTISVVNDGTIPFASILWNDGSTDSVFMDDAELEVEYFADVTSACGDTERVVFDGEIAEFCDCRDEIPQLITPNGDGTNDFFRLFTNCPVNQYTLQIFNRWGGRVFSSTDPAEGWDGRKDGTPQNSDVYLYRMAFRYPGEEEMQVREGQFSLVR